MQHHLYEGYVPLPTHHHHYHHHHHWVPLSSQADCIEFKQPLTYILQVHSWQLLSNSLISWCYLPTCIIIIPFHSGLPPFTQALQGAVRSRVYLNGWNMLLHVQKQSLTEVLFLQYLNVKCTIFTFQLFMYYCYGFPMIILTFLQHLTVLNCFCKISIIHIQFLK